MMKIPNMKQLRVWAMGITFFVLIGAGGGWVYLSGKLYDTAIPQAHAQVTGECKAGRNCSVASLTASGNLSGVKYTATAADGAAGFVCSNEGCRFCLNPSCTMYWESDGGGSLTTLSSVSLGSNATVSGALSTKQGTATTYGVVAKGTPVTSDVGNVGAGTDDLMTYAMAANTIASAGRGVRITAWGTTANNVNAKTVTLNFGSQVIMTQALTTSIAGTWRISAVVLRSGTDTQDIFAELLQLSTIIHKQTLTSGTQDDGAAITIKCTGTATSNNDIVQDGLLVEVF
jgi:hypothetical protein